MLGVPGVLTTKDGEVGGKVSRIMDRGLISVTTATGEVVCRVSAVRAMGCFTLYAVPQGPQPAPAPIVPDPPPSSDPVAETPEVTNLRSVMSDLEEDNADLLARIDRQGESLKTVTEELKAMTDERDALKAKLEATQAQLAEVGKVTDPPIAPAGGAPALPE